MRATERDPGQLPIGLGELDDAYWGSQ